MNTANNITAMQVSGTASTPQSQSSGQSSQGLQGFLEAFLQQIQGGNSASPSAQTSLQGINGLAEKIAALLKKDGVSATDLQTMSPQDLAAKITQVLQQQNIKLPASLQNMSSADLSTQLASLIQQNGATASAVKSGLTSDLVSAQSATIQDTQTKDDVAKKISDMLEQQQQQGTTAALNPAQLQQLKADFAQLQSAPGTISPDTMSQLTTDLSSFLTNQGVSQSSIASFLADLTQSVQQKDQTQTADAAAANAATTPTMPAGTAVQPTVQPQQTQASSTTSSSSSSSAAGQISDATSQTAGTAQNFASRFGSQDDKTQILGGKEQPLGENAPAQQSAEAAQQSPQTPAPQQSLTGKINGFSINPALINDLANGDSSGAGAGSGNGSGSQGNNAQQSQDVTGNTALLQPLSADMIQSQNFTNYMAPSSSSQPSATTQQVTIQLQSNASAGINTMNLQLEPAELGKVDVKLTFAKDGTVKAHMTVDKPETLAALQKDSSHLQRALQQSELTTDENSLSFDLRQQSQQQNMGGFNNNGGHGDEFDSHMDGNVSNALQAQLAIQSSGYITQSGVNIMV